ncbi:uncharacterized protein PADG_01179 [Paracoccidioides brasiliensis Pb18]|uniref:Uncharacterized protein n=1 Tax=Paracoccidioides brasiliensis (strain Pb18) TaxID=502780 RepID=C1FZF3_PARBD|nr:uncharacterized protein PADG_01179 [Paracoccidioides brasiliensis Pb18]EEH44890.2 hypothetical protein PADG_01179 [Paracoccidioides brasiliensis Pb18]
MTSMKLILQSQTLKHEDMSVSRPEGDVRLSAQLSPTKASVRERMRAA